MGCSLEQYRAAIGAQAGKIASSNWFVKLPGRRDNVPWTFRIRHGGVLVLFILTILQFVFLHTHQVLT